MKTKNKIYPDFYLLGAAKCGTTSVAATLKKHPEIFIPSQKELHVFDNDKNYNNGKKHYTNIFSDAGEKLKADCTPSYFHSSIRVRDRIANIATGREKFVVIIRDPVERAYSHYLHLTRARFLDESFMDLFKKNMSCISDEGKWVNIYSDGLYAVQLSHWFEAFEQRDFLILLTEELKENPKKTLQRIYNHLGVDETLDLDIVTKNTQSHARSKYIRNLTTSNNALKRSVSKVIPLKIKAKIMYGVRKLNVKKSNVVSSLTDECSSQEIRFLYSAYKQDIGNLESMLGWKNTGWIHEE